MAQTATCRPKTTLRGWLVRPARCIGTDRSRSSITAAQVRRSLRSKVRCVSSKTWDGSWIIDRGGRGEIRTHERVAPLPVFKTGALTHSATLPAGLSMVDGTRLGKRSGGSTSHLAVQHRMLCKLFTIFEAPPFPSRPARGMVNRSGGDRLRRGKSPNRRRYPAHGCLEPSFWRFLAKE